MLNTIAWEIIIYFRCDESDEHKHTREKLQSLTCKPHGNILSLLHLLKAQMHVLLYVQWKYFPTALLITRNIKITELNGLKEGCLCIRETVQQVFFHYCVCSVTPSGLGCVTPARGSGVGLAPALGKKKKKKAESEITVSEHQFSRASQIHVFKISVIFYKAISKGSRSTNGGGGGRKQKTRPL